MPPMILPAKEHGEYAQPLRVLIRVEIDDRPFLADMAQAGQQVGIKRSLMRRCPQRKDRRLDRAQTAGGLVKGAVGRFAEILRGLEQEIEDQLKVRIRRGRAFNRPSQGRRACG